MFESAEDVFRKAWDTELLDRDFRHNEDAQEKYGEEQVENVEHFIFPEEEGDSGLRVRHSIPIELFSQKYREELENREIELLDRIEKAEDVASDQGEKRDEKVLRKTKERLEGMSLL